MSTDHTTDSDQLKTCSMCGEAKSRTEFYRSKTTNDGLQSGCRICRIAYQQAYRAKNPDKVRKGRRSYNKRNAEKRREYAKRYRKQNPDKIRADGQRTRARLMRAEGSHTIADMRRQYKVQKGLCWWCGKAVKWEDRHDDHLIPLSRGGTDWPSNMVVSCAFCNLSKHDKTPDEFVGRLF